MVSAQNLLNLRISIHVQNSTPGDILRMMEQQGNFFFAYNPDNIDQNRTVSISADHRKVRTILKELFHNEATFRQVENHIIINKSAKSEGKNSYRISGRIAAPSDAPLDSAIVYDPENEKLVISQEDGSFTFDYHTHEKNISLFVSLSSYKDTVIYLGPGNRKIDLTLQRTSSSPNPLTPKGTADMRVKLKNFENLSLVQKLVPPEAIYAASRLHTGKVMPVQFSFLPKMGTNSFVQGLRVNHASFNLLAGYSKGVIGAEFGGIANIIQNEVRGVQAAGIANVVLGDVHGVQFSGIYTRDLSQVNGFQMSGVFSTLEGRITGGQISGISNFAFKQVNGAQVSGVLNVAKGEIAGAQVAGIVNITHQRVSGLQLSGVWNESGKMNGLQLSSLINLNHDQVRGAQITSILNRTKILNGLQFGLINLADTIQSGFQVGLVNIVKHGTYKLELTHNETFPVDIRLITGNPELYSFILLASEKNKLAFGYGLGSNIPLNRKWAFWTDGSCSSIRDSRKLIPLGLKLTMRHGLNYALCKPISLRAGISENYFIPGTPKEMPSGNMLFPGNTHYIEQALQNGKNRFWNGWFFGIQVSNLF